MDTDLYFFLSSSDSLLFHPDNNSYNFIIELPERIHLEGEWVIGLCDFYHSSNLIETIFVLCDICDNSYIGDSLKPILRIIYPNNNQIYFNYKEIYYVKVKNYCLNRLKVYIRDEHFKIPSSITGTTRLTLHLKKIK